MAEHDPFHYERVTLMRVCESIGSPRALAVWLLAEHSEWQAYLDLPPVNKDPFTGPADFAGDYLVSEMLTKHPSLPGALDSSQRRAKARVKWYEAEDLCRETNERLALWEAGLVSPVSSRVENLVHRTRRVISAILWDSETSAPRPSSRELASLGDRCRFGPGSSSSVNGVDVCEGNKFVADNHVTSRLKPWIATLYGHSGPDFWSGRDARPYELREYSKCTFVPKNSKIDRAIAIEPHCNIYVQLGIGSLLRERLARFGLNLNCQADVNRYLASRALADGLCTIDLSSASDTVAKRLVDVLLPPEWGHLLEIARTPSMKIGGKLVRLEKWSSMGNGYTFELESLLFYAMALAVGSNKEVTGVFGDDIIVEKRCAEDLLELLRFCGFSVNSEKTFLIGVFYESCGADYFQGRAVRPFYLKGRYSDEDKRNLRVPELLIRICNKVRRYSNQLCGGLGCDARFRRVWGWLSRQHPLVRETGIPDGYGEGGLVVNFDEAVPDRALHGHCGYVANVLRSVAVKRRMKHSHVGWYLSALKRSRSGVLADPLSSLRYLARFDFGSGVSTPDNRRSDKRQLRRGVQVVRHWTNLGPWVG